MDRIKDKIEEIEKYLQELSEIIPLNFDKYKFDFKTRAACERYSEKIIGATTDLTFLIIKEYKLKIPEEERKSFDILNEEKIISDKLKDKLKDARGMRNILAHEYGKVDDEVVFDSIKDELISDVEEFLKQIKQFLKK